MQPSVSSLPTSLVEYYYCGRCQATKDITSYTPFPYCATRAIEQTPRLILDVKDSDVLYIFITFEYDVNIYYY